MSTLDELMKERENLDQQIKEAEKAERAEDLNTVKNLCRKHGFTYNMIKNSLAKGRQRRKA
jgi:hypothetical protein